MTEYAGTMLPITFPAGVKNEHLHTRSAMSYFDVSHMGQIRISGEARDDLVNTMFASDAHTKDPGFGTLSLMLNENGGIEDDSIVTKHEDSYFVVVNGACKEKDFERIMSEAKNRNVTVEKLDHFGLLAVQGPKAMELVQRHLSSIDLKRFQFMQAVEDVTVADVDGCRLMRCGYTGEDGFEISVPSHQATVLLDRLCEGSDLAPAGLGARDSLRLEAGMCLYGNDMNSHTGPVSAGLGWTLAKTHHHYIGYEAVKREKAAKSPFKRVGISFTEGGIPRQGAKILTKDGEEIGHVTSGCFSPTLDHAIAMAYLDTSKAKRGTTILAKVRNRGIAGKIVKMPFVPPNYFTPEV